MRKKIFFVVSGVLFALITFSQPLKNRTKYNLKKEKVLYTIGYSHLDTEWNWDYPATIDIYIKNIMTENFHLFEKYPDYVYNFTGSRRYRMMKEYYPELYKKVVDYIHQGRWYVSGSSVDEGEVNVSSSESLIRQVLYGNNYYRKEFGVFSQDYMLPDCFGFLANVPSIWNHCGLLGFSTQKLTWRSAVGVPFNVGVWNGPDGKGIIAALNATSYVGKVVPRLDLDDSWNKRLEEDQSKYGISFDYRYYGVGDQGGAPRERDVVNAVGSLRNNDSKLKVVLTSSDQMYKDITPDLRKKLPVYSGDLLLIEHSAGSMTSQAYMKRMNRKNELLAKAAEQAATMANWAGNSMYPSEKLNNAWELVLGSQFHDILPGTSIPKAYEYAWNDEFIAANGFARALENSLGKFSEKLNTVVKGRALVVYNPVAFNREDVVTAEMVFDKLPENVTVYDAKGKALPTQIIDQQGNKLKFIFLAEVPSAGVAVFDVRESGGKASNPPDLKFTDRSLENDYYIVKLADNGDLTSIFDKKAKKELLAGPASLEFMHEKSVQWPAWNMNWSDRNGKAPEDYLNHDVSIKVLEQGNVRVALEIKRKGMNSEITQIVSLASGEAGKRIEIANQLDWQSTGVSLKAAFPLTVSNKMATYNLGVGTIQRGNNDSVKFEVPAKQWFDLTDQSGQYGVTILEDCKYGSDKPNDNTLRLTLLYTPEVGKRYVYQNSQDWGEHEFRYGIYGHAGSWEKGLSPVQGEFFNQPLLAFEAPKHRGDINGPVSFVSCNNQQVGVMALKKMEEGDYYLVRVNELSGRDLKSVSLTFAGNIADAYEVNGQEQKIGPAEFSKQNLTFDLSHYTIKSFAVKLTVAKNNSGDILQQAVELPYNQDVISYDDNRDDGEFIRRTSLPAELMGNEIISEGIRFEIGNMADGEKNAVVCTGQVVDLPDGDFDHVYVLAAASEDTRGEFKLDNQSEEIGVQKWTGFVGQFYNREFALDGVTVTDLEPPYSKPDNIAWFASHCHKSYPSANLTYQYCYLYKYGIVIPKGAKKLTLPNNDKIVLMAVTAAKAGNSEIMPLQPLYDNFRKATTFSYHSPAK